MKKKFFIPLLVAALILNACTPSSPKEEGDKVFVENLVFNEGDFSLPPDDWKEIQGIEISRDKSLFKSLIGKGEVILAAVPAAMAEPTPVGETLVLVLVVVEGITYVFDQTILVNYSSIPLPEVRVKLPSRGWFRLKAKMPSKKSKQARCQVDLGMAAGRLEFEMKPPLRGQDPLTACLKALFESLQYVKNGLRSERSKAIFDEFLNSLFEELRKLFPLVFD